MENTKNTPVFRVGTPEIIFSSTLVRVGRVRPAPDPSLVLWFHIYSLRAKYN